MMPFPLAFLVVDDIIYAAAMIAISIAISSIAARLMSKDTWTGPRSADANANLSKKGEYLPVPFGQVRIGCLIGWIGKPKARVVRVGDGGRQWGLFGPKNGIYSTAFSCDGWHILCVGPVDGIADIFVDGKRVRKGPISRVAYPSGSTITIPHPAPQKSNDRTDLGRMHIYWGEHDQPVCRKLAAVLGIQSRWPGVCYIFWEDFELGLGGARWPMVEFVVQRFPSVEVGDRNGQVQEDIKDSENVVLPLTITPVGGVRGYNPSALLQVAGRSNFPHGLGLSSSIFPVEQWQEYHEDAVAQGFACHMVVEKGDTYASLASAVLADTSTLLNSEGMAFMPKAIREVASPPEASDDDLLPSEDEQITAEHSPLAVTNPVWVFSDEKQSEYAQRDIGVAYDTGSIENGVVSTRRTTINTITNRGVAVKAAGLQRTNTALGSELRLSAMNEFQALSPGDVFGHPTLGYLRVHSTTWTAEEPALALDCVVDNFKAFLPASDTDTDDDGAAPQADRQVWFFFRPAQSDPSAYTAIAARLAYSPLERLAVYRITVAGATEQRTAPLTAGFAWGGSLVFQMGEEDTEATIVSYLPTPEFEVLNPVEVAAGKRLLLVDEEIIYADAVSAPAVVGEWSETASFGNGDVVQSSWSSELVLVAITPGGMGITGTAEPEGPYLPGESFVDHTVTWRVGYGAFTLTGLRRGQEATSSPSHATGSHCAVLDAESLATVSSSVRLGDMVCLGTVPFGNGEFVFPEPSTVCKNATSGVNALPEGDTLAVGDGNEIVTSLTTLSTIRVQALS